MLVNIYCLISVLTIISKTIATAPLPVIKEVSQPQDSNEDSNRGPPSTKHLFYYVINVKLFCYCSSLFH